MTEELKDLIDLLHSGIMLFCEEYGDVVKPMTEDDFQESILFLESLHDRLIELSSLPENKDFMKENAEFMADVAMGYETLRKSFL